jgi:nucleoside-diphosphate-sugar epimerase
LLDERQVAALPEAAGVVSMSGYKFGTRAAPHVTWATNCCIPDLICRRYRGRPIVAFSTGNVYGMVPRESGGSRETDVPRPEGEYAMAALGRERVYEYFSACEQTPVVVLRLNYATELRYGVLVDLAQQIQAGQAVDVTMGSVNVIWLADANAMTLVALKHAASPARILNLAGADILGTRDVAQRLAHGLGQPVQFVGREGETALLSNAQAAYALLGRPVMPASQMIDWTAQWVAHGGPTLGKPTHFQVHTGEF